jgi:hypothetical protein
MSLLQLAKPPLFYLFPSELRIDAYVSHDKGLRECIFIESFAVGVLNYYYIYSKESRDLTPYSESPVQALQGLNRDSRAVTEPPERNTGA